MKFFKMYIFVLIAALSGPSTKAVTPPVIESIRCQLDGETVYHASYDFELKSVKASIEYKGETGDYPGAKYQSLNIDQILNDKNFSNFLTENGIELSHYKSASLFSLDESNEGALLLIKFHGINSKIENLDIFTALGYLQFCNKL